MFFYKFVEYYLIHLEKPTKIPTKKLSIKSYKALLRKSFCIKQFQKQHCNRGLYWKSLNTCIVVVLGAVFQKQTRTVSYFFRAKASLKIFMFKKKQSYVFSCVYFYTVSFQFIELLFKVVYLIFFFFDRINCVCDTFKYNVHILF